MGNKWIITVYLAIVALGGSPAWSYQAYITDSIKVTMRSGPSIRHKIIAMLVSGQPVEVLRSESGWSLVRTPGNPDSAREGWVLTRFLIRRPPWKVQYETLYSQHRSLKEAYVEVQQRYQELTQGQDALTKQLAETKDALKKLQKDYDELRRGAANYLKLKEEFDRTKEALHTAQHEVEKLAIENESLRYSENMKWFALGVLVPFVGWLVGWVMGRRRKQKRSPLFR